MTRAKISEYSATANDNTDVNGVDIAEGCPPSSMNNMGREIMAALKRFQVGSDGDGVTVGGALVVSGATTANTLSATNVTASGTITTAAGTASAPAIVPTGDTNTGIFFPAADTIAFAEGGVERMRITPAGEVLIGKATTDFGTAGLYFQPTGESQFVRAGAPILVNRLTTDGDLITFWKDGTGVGAIGVVDGNDIYITSDNVALRLGAGSSAGGIYPANSNGTVRDNATNLGGASERFKDLYLSGSVYLGGTTSANALDDYEEGTFTPTVTGVSTAGTTTYTSQFGFYTKIGRQVFVVVDVTYTAATGTGGMKIQMPFASANSGGTSGVGSIMTNNLNWTAGTYLTTYMPSNNSNLVIYGSTDDGAVTQQNMTNEAANLWFSISYFTA